ncbi:MAG: hypothetical protein JNM39_15050 [Bdellovibrionaceae bacterium]|nr:hypothetical protein [Pseudobdellovibrionaceae bacterium]
MKKIIGLFLLTTALFNSAAYAQESYLTQTIVGIGAILEKLPDGRVHVNTQIANAPAERTGLAVGDVIVALIRGPVGMPAEISFVRGNSGPIVLSIVREKFEVDDGE